MATPARIAFYQSKAGKVEFDIFFPAGANAREIEATEKTVLEKAAANINPSRWPAPTTRESASPGQTCPARR